MTNNILKQISMPVLRAIIFLTVSIAVSLYFADQINKISETIKGKRETLLLYQNGQEQFAALKEDYPKVSPYIEKVKNVFLSSDNILPFINAMESLATTSGVAQSLRFENVALQPVASLDLSAIPFSIALSGNRNQFLSYLTGLEKLPYFTKIESLDMQAAQNFEGQSQISIRGVLYVK